MVVPMKIGLFVFLFVLGVSSKRHHHQGKHHKHGERGIESAEVPEVILPSPVHEAQRSSHHAHHGERCMYGERSVVEPVLLSTPESSEEEEESQEKGERVVEAVPAVDFDVVPHRHTEFCAFGARKAPEPTHHTERHPKIAHAQAARSAPVIIRSVPEGPVDCPYAVEISDQASNDEIAPIILPEIISAERHHHEEPVASRSAPEKKEKRREVERKREEEERKREEGGKKREEQGGEEEDKKEEEKKGARDVLLYRRRPYAQQRYADIDPLYTELLYQALGYQAVSYPNIRVTAFSMEQYNNVQRYKITFVTGSNAYYGFYPSSQRTCKASFVADVNYYGNSIPDPTSTTVDCSY